MTHLAIAFAIAYPGVTSAIIGPRTMEQLESQLPAAQADASAGISRSAASRSSRTVGRVLTVSCIW